MSNLQLKPSEIVNFDDDDDNWFRFCVSNDNFIVEIEYPKWNHSVLTFHLHTHQYIGKRSAHQYNWQNVITMWGYAHSVCYEINIVKLESRVFCVFLLILNPIRFGRINA